jgi:hypothetical protein
MKNLLKTALAKYITAKLASIGINDCTLIIHFHAIKIAFEIITCTINIIELTVTFLQFIILSKSSS